MNNFKSQGQTFEEARANIDEGVFVEDPFFKNHLENIRKQRELGLEFDMDKVEDLLTDLDGNPTGFRVGSLGLDYSDIPAPIRNRITILDMDQLRAVHGAETEVQAEHLMDMITMLPPNTAVDGDFVSFEVLKGRSPTGRLEYQFLPDMHHMMPRLNKTYMPPKDGDAFICMEEGLDWKRLEELCAEGIRRPDIQISGEDPALPQRKHPMIFKVTDLIEDEKEFPRLKATLERNRETEKLLGWPAPPMFIESIPDANIVARACADLMSQLTSLAKEYDVEIYFGTKSALKTALYTLMYGGKKKDLNMSQLDEISVEKAKEMLDKQRKVAIVGAGGSLNEVIKRIIAEEHGMTVCIDSFETWGPDDLAAHKIEKPARDWEHTKLRRGKGHNKFKRKGKK